MPRELVAVAPRTPVIRSYPESPLGANEVRVRTEFASPKHGTELVGYRNDPAAQRHYDRDLGAVVDVPGSGANRFPMALGNMAVGVVSELGSEVTRFRVGDRVFGHWPIRETHTGAESDIDLLPVGLSAEAAVCLDPAVMAFPIRDARVGIGDRIAIFGMGAIGLFAMQMARMAGADQVISVDPLPDRRGLSVRLGADIALDPAACGGDVGRVIREMTGVSEFRKAPSGHPDTEQIIGGYSERASQTSDLGVDVAVEASGSIRALQQAIRATRFGGTICVLSYYGGDSAGLRLGEEFHINRLQLVSARAQSLPLRDAPGWTLSRIVETTLAWLVSGKLRVDGIVTPVVSFDDAVDAYREIDEHPERSIKLGVRFG